MLYGAAAMAEQEEKMEISYDPLVLELSVPFQSQFEAEVAHNTLVVDPEPPRSEVIKSFRVDGAILHITLQAREARMLRVATGAFFDLLILVTNTIEQFGPQTTPQI
ncbi:EKC/KEOPS complex subunit LAGE3-like [Halichondria panicea]|uniref:EKC/KEOPS complex subunit LAGE3-like n=1 Tax=Halichondria panicea TaxID=6063 RepID=UPI00312B57E7